MIYVVSGSFYDTENFSKKSSTLCRIVDPKGLYYTVHSFVTSVADRISADCLDPSKGQIVEVDHLIR